MPRAARKAPGEQVYHVLNRAVGKRHLCGKDADFEAFQRVMIESHQRQPIRILSYGVWQFAVWPDADGQVTAFCRWLAHTHAMRMRWRVAHRTVGYGHLDRGRFQSFPVPSDDHLLTVLRYIERNAGGSWRT
jgi:putative transposase